MRFVSVCTTATALVSLVTFGNAANVRILRSVIWGTEGNEGIFGLVAITESEDGSVTIEAEVSGLPDGDHGFHVHQFGDDVGKTDGTATGGHFDPRNIDHAGPEDDERHVGDLGNIASSGGVARYQRTFAGTDPNRPTIVSDFKNSIIGRSFVLHSAADDLKSQPTGNAGARLAVGVIGIGNQDLYNEKVGSGGVQAVEVTEHINAAEFEEPKALVCNIRWSGESFPSLGYGSVAMKDGSGHMLGARIRTTDAGKGPFGYHVHWYGEEYEYTGAAAPNGTENTTMGALAEPSERDLLRTGGHYNPTGVDHGLPPAVPRHYGDGGSIQVVGSGSVGVASSELPSNLTTLRYLVGRTCVVHADPDDGSQPSGNAGSRIAAGQLGYANPETCVDPTACILAGEVAVEVDDSSALRFVANVVVAVVVGVASLVLLAL